MGVSAFPEHASNTEALIKLADEALYRAKKEGRDRIVVVSPPSLSLGVAR
jgi:diguanylate cyclase (GGDEF)-like protein